MAHSSSAPNILIVEDEWIIALDIKRHLGKLGYGVAGIANCAEKAMELFTATKPDLILMDIYLQGEKNGIDVAEMMRQQFSIPIVFLTAHADDATVKQAVSTHPEGYVIKPFEEQDLSVAIQIALAKHQAEQAIHHALENQMHLNELKSQFISIVSHEFRNPLGSLLLMINALERQSLISPEKQHDYAQRAKAVIKEMAQLIDDVLIVGEVEREQFQCQPLPIDVVWLCSNLIEDLQARPNIENNIVLVIEGGHEAERPFYELDAKLLRHILTNLLENAVKYSPDNSEVTLRVHCESKFVQFQIQDQGIGLTKQDQQKLFTPFHRGINVGKIRGTGLGLSIVKKCVDAHGGKISVESEAGIGTLFTVTLYAESVYE